MDDGRNSRLFVLGGISGIVGTASYGVAAGVSLSPVATYAFVMVWPILSIILLFALFRFIGRENQSASNHLALLFGSLAFTLVAAMISMQLAVKIGIDEYMAKAPQDQQELLGLMKRSLRLLDLGVDVAWDLFIGTALLFLSFSIRRVKGFGLWWSIPLALLAIILIVLNVATFPWPPNTRNLFDIGPVIALLIVLMSIRLLVLGIRMKAT